MSLPTHTVRPALRCLRYPLNSISNAYSFSSTAFRPEDVNLQPTSTPPALDPSLVSTRREERLLIKSGVQPIGSRRRRAALQNTQNIPFEQLPYQCFQEARKILQAHREEKVKQIEVERRRIAKAEKVDPAKYGGEASKRGKLNAMHLYLEKLKILADINDPVIKKRFEDGEGDMNRPIYRHLADQKWREYKRPLILQRITQMNVVPDVLPHLDPVAEVTLSFGRRTIPPGEFVDSRISEQAARVNVQVFTKGHRLVSIIVVDSDVPNLETDNFDYRCHFLAVNIPVSPTDTSIPFARLSPEQQILLPWLPPHAQKGSPYHRLTTFICQQPEDQTPLDAAALRDRYKKRDGFNLRSFNDRHHLKPIGVHLFRSIWDEGTVGVMKRAGIPGAEIELKRKKSEKGPYKKKDSERYR